MNWNTSKAKVISFLAGLIASTSLHAAGIAPRQNYVTDVSKQPVATSLQFVQASSQDLGWTYKQGTNGMDFSTASLVLFTFTPKNSLWSQPCTGVVEAATSGKILVRFTPAQLNTNGVFNFRLEVQNSTQTLAQSFGTLNLQKDYTHGVTSNFPANDYSLIANYVPTSDVPYQAAITGLTAGAGINITGSGRSRTIASTVTIPSLSQVTAVGATTADRITTGGGVSSNDTTYSDYDSILIVHDGYRAPLGDPQRASTFAVASQKPILRLQEDTARLADYPFSEGFLVEQWNQGSNALGWVCGSWYYNLTTGYATPTTLPRTLGAWRFMNGTSAATNMDLLVGGLVSFPSGITTTAARIDSAVVGALSVTNEASVLNQYSLELNKTQLKSWFWQSFRTTLDGYVTNISMSFEVPGSGSSPFTIYSGVGVGGTAITNGTWTHGTGTGFHDLVLNLPVTNETDYTIYVNSGNVNLDEDDEGRYTRGTSSSSGMSLIFKVYMNVPAQDITRTGGHLTLDRISSTNYQGIIRLPRDMNAVLLPTNKIEWTSISFGPFDQDTTFNKFSVLGMGGTATVYFCEVPSNTAFNVDWATTAVRTTNAAITGTTSRAYQTTFADPVLNAGNMGLFLLNPAEVDPVCSNIAIQIQGTYNWTIP